MTDISHVQGSGSFQPTEGAQNKMPKDPTKGVLPPIKLVIGQLESSLSLARRLGL